jgi:ABC-type sugar transport system, periplasmic component
MVRLHKITCAFICILISLLVFTSSCAIPVSKPNTTTLRILSQNWIYDKFKLDSLAKEFMSENPGINVIVDQYINYDTAFYPLMNKSNNRYDIFLGASREHIVQYAYSGALMDFDSGFFDSDLQKEDFFPSFLELGNISGRQYMIPLMGEIMCLVIRTDMFRDAGLCDDNGNPTAPKT